MNTKFVVSIIAGVALLGIGVYAAAQTPANVPPTGAVSGTVKLALPAWGQKNLKDGALQVAANLGESRPSAIRFVKTTRKAAAKFLDSSRVDSDDASYVVIMHGSFTHDKAFMPPGAKAPTGNTLALVVRASDGAVTDLVLNNQSYRDMSLLGAVTDVPSD